MKTILDQKYASLAAELGDVTFRAFLLEQRRKELMDAISALNDIVPSLKSKEPQAVISDTPQAKKTS